MKDRNDFFEKAFDMMLDEAAMLADEELGNEISEPTEEIVFSKEHDEKMEKLFRAERNAETRKKLYKFSKRAACILLTAALASGVAVMSVEAWRIKFLNFVLDVGAPNTDYNFSDEKGSSYADDMVSMDYIPEGFELNYNESSSRGVFLEFRKDKEYFYFELMDIDVDASVDTENGTVEEMKINGYEAVFIDNPDTNMLIWHDNVYAFDIMGNIPKEELIKIAENVNK